MGDTALIVSLSITLTIFTIVSIFTIWKKCKQRRRNHGQVFALPDTGAPVVVTSATHTTAAGYPTHTTVYPPQTVYPAQIAQGYQPAYPAPYPAQTTPYPPANLGMPMPPQQAHTGMPAAVAMPQPMGSAQPSYGPGFQPHMAPYPPAQASDPSYHTNPPTYDQVVAHDPANYTKQSPYNPNFSGQ